MKSPISVNIISETEFSVKGHGVHTAYVEMRNALSERQDIKIHINDSKVKADIIHIHTMGPYSANFLLKSHGKKVISGHLSPKSFVGSFRAARLWQRPVAGWMRSFYNKADLVLAVSDYTKRELTKLGVKKPIRLLYNAIDTKKYASSPAKKRAARQKLGIAEDKFVVLGAGQVQPRKRIDLYVDFAKQMPDVEFVWVGGIPFGAMAADSLIMEKLMRSSLTNLQFTGTLPLEEMVDYYQAADVFVFPSIQETFGLVIVEAAAAGLPIVLRDIDDYRTTFADNSLLAPKDHDFPRLIQQLQSQLEMRRTYSQRAAQIAKRFDITAATDQLVAYYHQLLNGEIN